MRLRPPCLSLLSRKTNAVLSHFSGHQVSPDLFVGVDCPESLPSSVVAFLYPGYASYKTLSQRPASEEDLERWLMYWCVLGFVVGIEYVAEWVISW